MDASIILKKGRLRSPHLLDGVALFEGEAEDTYQAKDQTAGKASLVAAIAALVATFKEGYPFENEAAFDTAADTLNTDIAALINGETHITTLVNALKSEVFTAAIPQIDAAVAAHTVDEAVVYEHNCRRCKVTGRVVAGQELGGDPADETLLPCPSCDQLKKTEIDNVPVGVYWPATNEFDS